MKLDNQNWHLGIEALAGAIRLKADSSQLVPGLIVNIH
jgi:hypothetical protein